MSLLSVIDECGGLENVVRILSPDTRIIIEIRDCSLLSTQSAQNSYDSALQQVTYCKDAVAPADELKQQLLQAGKLIAQQQLADAQHYLQPVHCPHRPDWHISPPQGLLNDPNGFIYHQGQYHLFYQLYPYGCEHKDKYWTHLTSKDLVNWQWQSLSLTPSDWFDSHGVFSGHAVSQGEELMLFYTGNVRVGENRDRHTTQCLATSSDAINFTKQGPVITELPPGVTPHCRDPKVIRHNDYWLMLLGAQREDEIGRLAIYRSNDLKKWTFVALCGDELGDFGYMWECPDFFTLNNQDFIVICPQGISSPYPSHTVKHHNCIFKAAIDNDGKVQLCDGQPLDHGFDFYAPQSLQTVDGRRVMCAWMGLPDEIDHPSVDNGWLHQLTTLRQLSYENGQLIQQPLKELQSLRGDAVYIPAGESVFDLQSKTFELKVTMGWGSSLRLHQSESGYCEIRLDKETKTLYFDRANTLLRVGDTIRELPLLESESVQLHILSDNSSLELFINNGAAVMSARIFTPEKATAISSTGQVDFDACWLLHKAASPFVNSQE
ncbi:MAG: beta-fructofuranosidase [Psychromonas sp.]|jgi:beta-fructofuranosidase|uniref:glycoside hydrolase family 32 protein n=1 Tax=Psychromonas sp. TaxID=1884585 RepID=UPI0039E59DD1